MNSNSLFKAHLTQALAYPFVVVLTFVFTVKVVAKAEEGGCCILHLFVGPALQLLPMLAPSTSKYQHTFDHTQAVFVANSTAITEVDTAAGSIKRLGCNNRDQEEVGAAILLYSKCLKAATDPQQCQFLAAIATVEDLHLLLQATIASIAVACSLEASSYVGSAGNTCYSAVRVGTWDGSKAFDLANTITITAIVARLKCYFQSLAELVHLQLISQHR